MNGNPELKEGFTQIANELLTALAKAQMQGTITSRERAVIDFVIRYTYGYHEEIGNLRTSFIAKELETTPNYITHLLKRLIEKNIILKDGNEIAFNKHYNDWETVKLPYHKSKLFREKVAADGNSGNSITPKVITVSHNSDNSITIDPKQEQLKTNLINPLNKTNKYNINKTIKKEIIKERKITFNRSTFKFENIPKEKIDKWKEAFLNCNVDLELKKMEAWLMANPTKHKKNYEKFIVNWLSRAKGEENAKNKGNNGRYIPITGERKFTGLDANAGEW